MAADFHVDQVRVSFGIVGVLMVCQVLKAIVISHTPQGVQTKPVGCHFVQAKVFEQKIVTGLVSQHDQTMLTQANEENGCQRDGHMPPPGKSPGRILEVERKGGDDNAREKTVFTCDVKPIGEIIDFAQFVYTMDELGVAQFLLDTTSRYGFFQFNSCHRLLILGNTESLNLPILANGVKW